MPTSQPKTRLHFQESSLSPLRLQQRDALNATPPGHGFCVTVTCDIEPLALFTRRCRVARCRPPSVLAYLARCLGITLADRTELLASRLGNKVFVPSRVDAVIAAEVLAYDGSQTVRGLRFEDLGNRDLADIAEEMKVRLREAKRTPMPSPLVARRFVPERSPVWWHRLMHRLRESHPAARERIAKRNACVQLSSTAQWMEGYAAWGMRLYQPLAPSVMLVGQSRRPVVVGEQIAAHLCIDLAITFDHILVDGAPATRFIAALCKEIESGRALGEYPVIERKRILRREAGLAPEESATFEVPAESQDA